MAVVNLDMRTRKSNDYWIAKVKDQYFIGGRDTFTCHLHQISKDSFLFIELRSNFSNLNGNHSKKMAVGKKKAIGRARKQKKENGRRNAPISTSLVFQTKLYFAFVFLFLGRPFYVPRRYTIRYTARHITRSTLFCPSSSLK